MKKSSPKYPIPSATPSAKLALYFLGAATAAAGLNANAFQLGQLQSNTRIGEPLKAYISVVMSPRESQLQTTFNVLPAFAYRNDPEMLSAVKNISATLVTNEYGNHYISLSSPDALRIPALAFRIRAANGANTLIRNYTFTPNLPATPSPPQNIRNNRPARSNNVIKPEQLPVSNRANPSGEFAGSQWQVKAGDSLWKIATTVAANRNDAGKLVNQIFELNPQAFINGDINKLKQGVSLELPGAQYVAQAEPATLVSATPETADTVSEFAPNTIIETPSVNEPEAKSEEFVFEDPTIDEIALQGDNDQLAGSQLTTQSTIPQVLADVDWKARNPELASRLTELGDKYAAIRARYQEQQATQNDSDADANQAEAMLKTPDIELPVATLGSKYEQQTVAATDEAPTTPATASSSFVAPVLTETTATDNASLGATTSTNRFSLPLWAIGLIGLVVLLGFISLVISRTRAAIRRKLEQAERRENDRSLKQEMARKAQQRIQMESEVERMLNEHGDIEDDGDEIEKTMKLHVEDMIPEEFTETVEAIEETPQTRIDASIAHGRYGEAEELLNDVIADSPRNFAAKLRLAEVFYITERIEDFVEISRDIYDHHRPDISDEDWRRVMRMGKMIAPDQAPFSGPQSIIGDASAG